LWQIQTSLGNPSPTPDESLLVTDNIWVKLNPTFDLWLDVASFVQGFKQTQDVSGQDLSSDQAQLLYQAVELYHGELLTGWYQDWCLLERERLQAMYLAMLDKLIDYCVVRRQYESGIEYGMRILRIDYAREKTHQRLMCLYYLSGDRTSALRQFERCADILMRELKVKPTKSTKMLYEQILADQLSEWTQLSQRPSEYPVGYKSENPLLHELEQIAAYLSLLQRDVESIKQALER
jgi:DNA-binding SARP family transcriptional activator